MWHLKRLLLASVLLCGCGPKGSDPQKSDSLNPAVAQGDAEATVTAVAANADEMAVTGREIDPELCLLPMPAPLPTASTGEFSDYAWRQFVALSWPAKEGQRGEPDCNKPLAAPGPTVWQSFKTTDEVFLADAEDPGPWNSDMSAVTLQYTAKANASLPVEQGIAQAVGGWLIDQAGNPTYYAISINETSYDYVRENSYFDQAVVSSATNITFPTGSLEIKAAWKILSGSDSAGRFLTMQAQVALFDSAGKPTGATREATVGLVGLHIVYKAENYPQWLWATFEQVDNVFGPHGSGSYRNPSCTGEYCDDNVSPKTSGQPFDVPNQVMRVTPLDKSVESTNSHWQSVVADTPLEYYRLISPQWPVDPNDPGNPQGSPTPGVVANVTMETYIQPTSSCMDCHSTARVPGNAVKSNYSFIFLFAQAPAAGGAQ